MHLLFVADGRSPISRRWIKGALALNHQVTLVSTYPCEPLEGALATHILPVAFSALSGSQVSGGASSRPASAARQLLTRSRSLLISARRLLGPLTLPFYAPRLAAIIEQARPDLVHALRIPFEGMLAASVQSTVPLAVSIWGNDLTLHGSASPLMRTLTQRTLRRANGLAADVARDIRLAPAWGFSEDRATLVAPGNGGIDLQEMAQITNVLPSEIVEFAPQGTPLVIMPRGIRPQYVQNDVFFQAIPMVLDRRPEVKFICPSMAGQVEATRWLEKLQLSHAVCLLPYLQQPQLWNLFRRSEITVSVTTHDGLPNTLLEALSLGCFPIVGDIESLREWITPGVNGLLVEPAKPQALADAILLALSRPELRAAAAVENLNQVRNRAEIQLVRAQMQIFYQRVTD